MSPASEDSMDLIKPQRELTIMIMISTSISSLCIVMIIRCVYMGYQHMAIKGRNT